MKVLKKNIKCLETPTTFGLRCLSFLTSGSVKKAIEVDPLVPGGVANGTSKHIGLGKIWQDLEILKAFFDKS